jgi:hypothetical protein
MAAISVADIEPNEVDAVFSLPQKYYISTFTQWMDSKLQPQVYEPMRTYYRQCAQVACGMYVADYDPNCDDANVSDLSMSSSHSANPTSVSAKL